MMKYKIERAQREQAIEIARLIMLAMDEDCCQNFAGAEHTLEDFHEMMTELVKMEESQYSYRNTLVAVTEEGDLAGVLVAYEGACLHRLREAFIRMAHKYFNIDYSDMEDETQEGEYYLDSLAVKEEYQRQGIATALLQRAIDIHAEKEPIGLLVDLTHPWAEKLYTQMGFQYMNNAMWGGHAMKHMQYPRLA